MTHALDHELFAAASHAVESQLGLHFPPERWHDLERGLRGAASDLGFDSVEKYVRELVTAHLARAQIDSLAAHLTVGETYFFRDPAAFDALTLRVIPALVEERRGRAMRLRIWSAGCCTGEEPYSIAIALRRSIADLADWQVTILATDINPRFLQKAAAGVYGQWSFRGVPDDMRDAWFRKTPDGRFEVLPAIRKMVTFACLNLVEDVCPSLATNTNAMDLIICRNVLMYFSREQIRKVVANLRRSLVEGGRLVVSATEASREYFGEFVPAEIPGITLYRKEMPAPRPARSFTPPAPIAPPPVAVPARLPEPSPPAQIAPITPPEYAAEARRLANEGRLADALAACDRALAADKLVPAHHYLRGVILQEQNALDEGAASLKRALYLDPDFVVAHFALGHLLLRLGRHREAARCFANARSLLRSCAPDSLPAESDGLTAGRLLEILASMQEALV
ncbi:MAG TPA: CheR family methyltransferase [Chthoniobacteraceae bacterium]|nr:CheR family methyltransferase [Chthoniobacteraceae bacterium]